MCVQEFFMYAEQKTEISHDKEGHEDGLIGIPAPHILLHPEADQVEAIVRTAWGNARLVAD